MCAVKGLREGKPRLVQLLLNRKNKGIRPRTRPRILSAGTQCHAPRAQAIGAKAVLRTTMEDFAELIQAAAALRQFHDCQKNTGAYDHRRPQRQHRARLQGKAACAAPSLCGNHQQCRQRQQYQRGSSKGEGDIFHVIQPRKLDCLSQRGTQRKERQHPQTVPPPARMAQTVADHPCKHRRKHQQTALYLHAQLQEHPQRSRRQQQIPHAAPQHQEACHHHGHDQAQIAADHVNIAQRPLKLVVGADAASCGIQPQRVIARILQRHNSAEQHQRHGNRRQRHPATGTIDAHAQEDQQIHQLSGKPLVTNSAHPPDPFAAIVHLMPDRPQPCRNGHHGHIANSQQSHPATVQKLPVSPAKTSRHRAERTERRKRPQAKGGIPFCSRDMGIGKIRKQRKDRQRRHSSHRQKRRHDPSRLLLARHRHGSSLFRSMIH